MDKDKVQSWDDEDIRYEIRNFCNEIKLYAERIEKNVKEDEK